MKQRILFISVALVMAATLSACGKKGAPKYQSSFSNDVIIVQSV
ncbi:hypothetical protein [Sneathiella sp.]|jgi:predicted small lipoprotein YifL